MTDVIVVGGGPAGLAAAADLATRGHSVTVYEEHKCIGAPVHCTGVLAADAIKSLRLPAAAILNPLATVHFHAPSGTTFRYTTPNTEAIVIDRQIFDGQMANEAEAAGAIIIRGRRVTAVEPSAEGVSVHFVSGEHERSRVAVLACGAQYGVQRKLGLDFPPAYLHSAQLELRATSPGDVEIYFGSGVAPKGFAWVVPVQREDGTYARVGVMAAKGATSYFRQMLERVGPRWGIEVPASCAPKRRVLPLAAIRRTYTDRVLAVGDAGGLVKPTTGGGIYYAVVSGRLAAEVLSEQLDADDLRAPSLARYERLWRKRYQAEFDAQSGLRRIAEQMDDASIDALFDLTHTGGVLPLIRRYAAFNRHRDFIMALFRHEPARQVFRRQLAGMLS